LSRVRYKRFDAPRSHEDAVVHHDKSDADEPVPPGSGSDAQAFVVAELSQDVVAETLLAFTLALIVPSRTGA
jgi:hypothetical protein